MIKKALTAPVRFGIVSPGKWAANLIESVSDSEALKLAGVFSRDPQKASTFANKYGGDVYASYEGMLSESSIEAVLLPTPHFLHHSQAMAAMRAGKHVFVEKPMANTVEEAVEMHQYSQEHNLVLGVGQQLRRTGAARMSKAMIHNGELGEIILFRAALGANLLPQYSAGDWELDPEKIPGGPLDNLAIHYVDLMQYLVGPVRQVSGLITDRMSPTDLPSAACANLYFKNGAIGSLVTHQISAYVSELSIYGSAGVLHFRRAGQELWFQEVVDTVEAKKNPPVLRQLEIHGPMPHSTALREELEDFAKCIRKGGQPEVGGAEGITALRVIRAIMESNTRGNTVLIDNKAYT